MSFKGSIDEFSLLDIFHLMSRTKKTGQLTVTSEAKEGKISFDEGLVCFAITPQNRIPLGSRLINAGLVSQQDLEEALRAQQGEELEKKVGEILIARGLIKQEKLEEFVQEQIQDALFEILDWENGYYYFDSSADIGQENIGISFPVEEVIKEVEKRKEEWKKIKEIIPSTQLTAKISEFPGKQQEEIVLKPEEWRILYLLDQERSIADLREKSQLTLLKLCQTLKNMLSKNMVHIVPPSNNQPQESDETQPEKPEKTKLEVLQDAVKDDPREDESCPIEGGKYVKEYYEENFEETAKKVTVPLEWARYLKAPKKSIG